MSALNFLVTDLQSLASETRRKHPEIREAAEKSLSALRSSPEQASAALLSCASPSPPPLDASAPSPSDLLKPIFMGCATKNAKVISISLGSLQRLIALRAVPPAAVPKILTTMGEAMSQGVDIQLRILQTLVGLVPNFQAVNGELLGEALLLCFKLQESRIAVVSSTAAATLRQLVMFVIDKMVSEDRQHTPPPPASLLPVQLPDGTTASLGPSAADAFRVFEDLCLLANGEKPRFLKLDFLHKTFALELVESVLTNYWEVFRQHPELILLLRTHLCPLLLKALSFPHLSPSSHASSHASISHAPASFPLLLRCTRVVFLLLKQFGMELETEAEVFWVVLLRLVGGEEEHGHQEGEGGHAGRPQWVRVLAMEVVRGLCSSPELLRHVYTTYDARSSPPTDISSPPPPVSESTSASPPPSSDTPSTTPDSNLNTLSSNSNTPSNSDTSIPSTSPPSASPIFTTLITTLNKLVSERPALLGVGTQMGGVGVDEGIVGGGGGMMSPAGMSGMVGSIMSPGGVGGRVAGIMGAAAGVGAGGQGGLSVKGSSMRVQCIDQLDKADAPPIPEAYIYLLAVQCLVAVCEGLYGYTMPAYTAQVRNTRNSRPGTPSASTPAPIPSPTPAPLPPALQTPHAMLLAAWPPLLAALSFLLSTALSDELFADVLGAYQALASSSGMLSLPTPRDALLMCLGRMAVPGRVVACLEAHGDAPPPPTPGRSASLGMMMTGSGGEAEMPGLSERNLACLKAFLTCVLFLGGTGEMGESWFQVLEVLQNAEYVLTGKGVGVVRRGQGKSASTASGAPEGEAQAPRPALLSDLEPEAQLAGIQRVFDASKGLEDGAFRDFVRALCRLSMEMVGMQSAAGTGGGGEVEETVAEEGAMASLPPKGSKARRRVSGIHIPKTLRSGDFGISKLGHVAMLNIHRLIYRSPDVAWESVTSHLLTVLRLPAAPQPVRVQAARVLDDILLIVPRNLSTTGEQVQAQVQRRVLEVLAQQVVPGDAAARGHWHTSTGVELRRMGLETLHQILQASGHTFIVGWEIIFRMLESVCRPAPPPRSGSTDSVSVLNMGSTPPSPTMGRGKAYALLGLGNPSEKSYSALVKIAFQSLTLVCDSVSTLSPEHLRQCISTLGQFGRQADTNIALTAAASLLWSVSDAIQSKRKNTDQEPEYSELWMFLLLEVLGLCTDARPEVRDGAIQTLFRTMQLYGSTLSLETWDQCVWRVTFPLLDALTAEIRIHLDLKDDGGSAEQKAWDESKILALHSIGSIFNDFLTSKIIHLETFAKAWDVFVRHMQESVLLDNRVISTPALRCLEKAVNASTAAVTTDDGILKERVSGMLQRVWEAIDTLGGAVVKRSSSHLPKSAAPEGSPLEPFSQESLVAFVDIIQATRTTSRLVDGKEWDLERLTRLMAILKGVLTYPNSPDYRPDIDALPPVQAVVMNTIDGIDLTIPGSPSLVMRDLSEYATLAFLAAFDVQPQPKSQTPQTPQKRVTYIALSKKTMPMLVDLFLKFKESVEIYVDGTLEAVLSAYSIPVKLKYDCPAPSKFGKDLPLWKTATTCFLLIVKDCTAQLKKFEQEISDENLEGIWRQMLDVFRGGILADCSTAESFPLDVQEVEENFDLALIASLETDIVPHLGDGRVPDMLVSQLAKILYQGSRVYRHDEPDSPPNEHVIASGGGRSGLRKAKEIKGRETATNGGVGSTNFGSLVPRERFSYWCFDLLFLICSNTKEGQESRKRVAALSLSSLLNRCQTTLVGYVADEALRGNLPFPRAREEELLYVLRKLLSLRLWPGSLWATFSDEPSKYCVDQPGMDLDTLKTPSQLIGDATKRSAVAHLFYFYPVLCEIASTPRRAPAVWIRSSPEVVNPEKKAQFVQKSEGVNGHGPHTSEGEVIELDSRVLARECLHEVGKEMGVTR